MEHCLGIGIDIGTMEHVAIKSESRHNLGNCSLNEAEAYKTIPEALCMPKILWFGRHSRYRVIVYGLLGPSVDDLFSLCGHQLSLKTVLQLADQMISCLEHIHSHSYVHRDLKPGNFLMGVDNMRHVVHIIDFGMAECFAEPRPYVPGFCGSVTWASINAHTSDVGASQFPHSTSKPSSFYHTSSSISHCQLYGPVSLINILPTNSTPFLGTLTHAKKAQYPKDDLEALCYILVYLACGSLPWTLRNTRYSEEVHRLKTKMSPAEICGDLPAQFATHLDYARSLSINETPDYAELRKLYSDLFFSSGFKNDGLYDWSHPESPAAPAISVSSAINEPADSEQTTNMGMLVDLVTRPIKSFLSAAPMDSPSHGEEPVFGLNRG